MKAARATGAVLTVCVHTLGAIAFVYPFLLPAAERASESDARASDAPFLFSALAALLVAMAVADVRRQGADARRLALLGVLAGLNAALRLPGAFGGASLMFALPILCGYAFGPSFGFLLGATSMAASAVITGGIGPWLPFQMWALGWVGTGAGLLRPVLARAPIVGLAAYGWVAGMLFGALVNLWFWPFLGGAAEISWAPGIGAAEGLRRYWRFYLLTSLAWDSSRAIANAALVALLGRPLLRLFGRARERLDVRWRVAPEG